MRLNTGRVTVELVPDGAVQSIELPDPRIMAVPCEISVSGRVQGSVIYRTSGAGQRGSRSLKVQGTIAGDVIVCDDAVPNSNGRQAIVITGVFDRSLEIHLRDECALGGVQVQIESLGRLGLTVIARRGSNGEELKTDYLHAERHVEIMVGAFVSEPVVGAAK